MRARSHTRTNPTYIHTYVRTHILTYLSGRHLALELRLLRGTQGVGLNGLYTHGGDGVV